MTYTIQKNQNSPALRPGLTRAGFNLDFRADVYGWVIVPHRPNEAGQTVHLCGVADVRFSLERCSWMLKRTGSKRDALRQLTQLRNEQSAVFSGHFQDDGLHLYSVCSRRGQGVNTYIPGTGDAHQLITDSAWLGARPLSSHLGACPYDEPAILLLDRREHMDSFCVGTISGTLENGWYQMGWDPTRLVTMLPPLARGSITADTSWECRQLTQGRARWLLDQSGDRVPDLSYFLRKHPEWFQ